MKYIKTTDGIYEYGTNNHKNPPYYCVPNFDGTKLLTKEGLGEYPVIEHTIVKQSDNLEELFDECILENKDHTYQSLLVKTENDYCSFFNSFTKDLKNGWLSYCYRYLQNGCEIYGAIVVRGAHGEPILKPVAKMKKEGGWELL